MLLVKILGFGSNWWARFGRDPMDRRRFTRHAAYFNSAGLASGNKIRRYWVIPGLIRFNGVGDLNPQLPNRSVGSTFECADMTSAFGGNRLLFRRKVRNCATPDYYLLSLASDHYGAFDCRDLTWKSETVLPIAVSQQRDRAEALLLMRSGDWVRTSLGIWQLTADATRQSPGLEPAEK